MHEPVRPSTDAPSLRLVQNRPDEPLPRAISNREIFEKLLEAELRAGRLTRPRRKRVVGYAAQLGMTAVEAGRMIDQMRAEALRGDDPELRLHALTLIPAKRERLPIAWKLAALLAVAILIDLLFLSFVR